LKDSPSVVVAAQHVFFWQTPTANWAEIWALIILFLISILPADLGSSKDQGGGILLAGLLTGRDGRWSTSKASAVLWTYAVWFAFLSILLHTNGHGLAHAVLEQQYLLLLGLPVGSAIAAKAFTQNKVAQGKLVSKLVAQPDALRPQTNVIRGIGQLFSNDANQPDLLDTQYFGFNLLLFAYFLTRFLSEQKGLPHLPDALVALAGVSAAGYVSKKGVQRDDQPAIRSITPDPAKPGDKITIQAVNLADDAHDPVVIQIGRQKLAGAQVHIQPGPVATVVTATLPDQLPVDAAKQIPIWVSDRLGVRSRPCKLTIQPAG
jgi:hypothetical protein